MIELYEKFDKSLLSSYDREAFPGRIIPILTVEEADKAVDYLLSRPLLGLDTETRPSFRRGIVYKVALLQVSDSDTCFLFRLNRIGLPPSLLRLLSDTTITKVGLSLHDDMMSLKKREQFIPGTYVEIQTEVKKLGIQDMSLQKIYANLFHKKISKTQQLTNWEADVLSEPQKLYAATDAWACINIYEKINELIETNDYSIIHSEI